MKFQTFNFPNYSKLNMQKKIFFSFFITVCIILICLMLNIYYILLDDSKKQILYSANQTYNQTLSFLDSYYDTLLYASDVIYYNGDVQRILSLDSFKTEEDLAKRYREFLILDQVFTSIEMNNLITNAKIYIPDNIVYSNNSAHFYPLSQLQSNDDYQKYISSDTFYKAYFTMPQNSYRTGTSSQKYVSLLRNIHSTNGTGDLLTVAEISMSLNQLTDVLTNARISQNSSAYIVNKYNQQMGLPNTVDYIPYSVSGDWDLITYQNEEYYIKSADIFSGQWKFVVAIPEREFYASSIQMRNIFFIAGSITSIIIILLSYILSKSYTQRIESLNKIMFQIQKGNLELPDVSFGEDEIGNLYNSFCYMVDEIKLQMKQQYIYGQQAKSAELKALQAQINPHFLYNTLDLINWTALDYHAPEIADIVQNLAVFYRLSLNKGQEITTLHEELQLVSSYVDIENYHFDNSIHLHIDSSPELLPLACLHIIIQPIVENSILHGMRGCDIQQECNININCFKQNEQLVITIQDDGIGMSENILDSLSDFNDVYSSNTHGYGLHNIKERLQLLYGSKASLTFESKKYYGTIVTLQFPALTLQELKMDFSQSYKKPES